MVDCEICGEEKASCSVFCSECLQEDNRKIKKQGAIEEIKLLEVFNAKNFMNKPYVLLRKYCDKRLKDLKE